MPLPIDLRHNHRPWWLRLELWMETLNESVSTWLEVPFIWGLPRGGFIAFFLLLVFLEMDAFGLFSR